ncbi:MAG: hypothetical protein IKS98_03755 [Lachnospiraceae bacterium]|nr:hypothetical protein [Lachnospiraceae bacterium]
MRYLITEEDRKKTGSSEFIEFQRGKYDGECWHIDSMYIAEETFYELKLRRFFSSVLPQFDYYGLTQVNASEFADLKKEAPQFSNEAAECMAELYTWIGDGKNDDVVFTICGM